MFEHRVALPRNTYARKFGRHGSSIQDLDSAQVVEVPGFIGVIADAVGHLADLPGKFAKVRQEALPLRGDARAGLARVPLRESGDQEWFAVLEAWRFQSFTAGHI